MVLVGLCGGKMAKKGGKMAKMVKMSKFQVKKNPGKRIFLKKKNFIIQSGMKKRPMQAFTALCRTKIVAATPVQRGGRF